MTDGCPRHVPDHHLLARIGQQDIVALGELYDRYSTLIYTLALRITRDSLAAEQLVIEVFQLAWSSPERCQAFETTARWLIAVTHDRSRTTPPRIGHRLAHARQGLTAPILQGALYALPPAQRRAVELAYYERLGPDEIAAHLDIPVPMARAHLRDGLRQLYALMGTAESPVETQKRGIDEPNDQYCRC